MIRKGAKHFLQTPDGPAIRELPSGEDVPSLPKCESNQLPERPSFVHSLWRNVEVFRHLLGFKNASVLLNEAGFGVQSVEKRSSQRIGLLDLFQNFGVAHRPKHGMPVVGSLGGTG